MATFNVAVMLEFVTKNIQETLNNMKKFRLQLLTTMFIAKSFASSMRGLLEPAAESAGIFEIIGSTLEAFFIPAMVMLVPLIATLSQFFLDIPGPVKEFIGLFLSIAFIVATVTASIIGLILLLGAGGISASVIGIAAAIIALVALIVVAWDELVQQTKDIWEALKNYFSAWYNLFFGDSKSFLGRIADVYKATWALIKEVFMVDELSVIWEAIWGWVQSFVSDKFGVELPGIFETMGKLIKLIFQNLGITISNTFKKMINTLIDDVNGFIRAYNKIPKLPNISLIDKLDLDSLKGLDSVFKMTGPNQSLAPTGNSFVSLASALPGGMSPVTVNQNLTIQSRDDRDIKRIVDEENNKLVQKLNRQQS